MECVPGKGDRRQSMDGNFRILIDCTQTLNTPITTGIQRVVRNLVAHGQIAAQRHGVPFIPIRFRGKCFERAPLTGAGTLAGPTPRARERIHHRFLYKIRKLFLGRAVRKGIDRVKGVLGIESSSADRLEFQPNDVLVLPDSSWSAPIWQEIDRARDAGLVLGVLQHDFIPLRFPEFVSDDCAAIFQRWTKESLSRADFVMGVSNTIAQECREELHRLGRHLIAEEGVSVCLNGADFRAATQATEVRPEIVQFIEHADGGPYLTVGTIEPRKNQSLLLDALDEILHSVPNARFLVAGFIGWKGKSIAKRIREHPGYGENVLLVSDMSDAELTYAYQRAKAVVFPSLAEGFGLPIAESIARGTRVFASSLSVHQEIGGKHCVYFDPEDSSQLAQLIIDHYCRNEYPAVWPPMEFRLPTWEGAAETMVATSMAMARRLRSSANGSGRRWA